jgi:hypothetical protein
VSCPVADELWERGLYLPSSHTLSKEQINLVAREVLSAASAAA